MLFPYSVDVGMKRWPIANWGLIAATVLIGFPCWADPEAYFENAERGFFYLARGDDFAWYQLVGNLFGHAGALHLIGNMWMLFLYGNAVNAKIGHLQYLLLYFAIGIGESLIWLWFGEGFATLGASGAVMGIVGAFVALYPQNNVSVFYWLFIVKMGTWHVSAYIVIAIYVLLDFIGVVSGGGAVNHLAHLAGAMLGFGSMIGACATGLLKAESSERTMLDVFRGRKSPGTRTYSSRPTPSRAVRNTDTALGQPVRRPPPRTPADDAPIPLVDESESPKWSKPKQTP